MNFNPGLSTKIIDALNEAGCTAVYVGGCIRDYVLGIEPHDYDIATSAKPEKMVEVLTPIAKAIIPTGLKHGTLSVLMEDGSLYEVTTFRMDGKYSDSRHPDDVTFTYSLTEDLSRRDFTINAMAMFWPSMEIVDPFGGRTNCYIRSLECVGDADRRFEEDPLRILRGIRFMAQLDLSNIDVNTSFAMMRQAPLLRNISAERISAELSKIMRANPDFLLECYDVLTEIIPEMKPLAGFKQNNPYHKHDVYDHTRFALQKLAEHAPTGVEFDREVVSLALLLHDVGKPASYTEEIVDGKVRGHFYGHEGISADIAKQVLRRLRFPNEILYKVVELIANHNKTFRPNEKIIRRLMNRHGVLQTRHLLYHNLCDTLGRGAGTLRYEQSVEEAEATIELFEDMLTRPQPFCIKDLEINGRDVLELGVPAGPMVGRILKSCLDAVMEEQIPNDRTELLDYALYWWKEE